MVVLVVVVASAASAVLVSFAVRRWPSADPAADVSKSVGRKLKHDHRLGFLRARFDPTTATGFALTAASICVILGGVLAGILFYLVRSRAGMLDVDTAVADWAAAHASSSATTLLRAITTLGSTRVIVGVSFVVGLIEFRRIRSKSLWLFLILTVGGELLVVNLIKAGVARARPAIDPLASFSGSSFPSGHTAASAACYAALALVASRGRTPRTRATLAGLAAGIAVAVGISRVLLGVHWFTDVLAGLAVGWAWFALCAIATGGRLLRFGTPAQPDMKTSKRQPHQATREGSSAGRRSAGSSTSADSTADDQTDGSESIPSFEGTRPAIRVDGYPVEGTSPQ